jgi:dihydrofolate reductase
MEIAMVVAADEQNGIGADNKLLCYLPNDLKYFKQVTTGSAVLMGRKTYESIGKPLPNRTNLMLSKTAQEIEGCQVFTSFEAVLDYAKQAQLEKLFIIGGDSIYKQALPLCHKVYLTRIHHTFKADAFFTPLPPSEFTCTSAVHHDADEKNAYAHSFEVYERIIFAP